MKWKSTANRQSEPDAVNFEEVRLADVAHGLVRAVSTIVSRRAPVVLYARMVEAILWAA